MRLITALLLPLAWLASAWCGLVYADDAVQVSFDQDPLQPYTTELIRQDWANLMWDGMRGRASIEADTASAANHFMRIKYPANQFGPTKSGSQALVRLPASEGYYLSYRVRFQKGFDFRHGGKLPGLASGDGKYSNGVKPVNGDGWTSRLMWLEDGKLIPYIYYVGMPKENHWGESWDLGIQLQPEKWYTITQYIRLNTPGQSNGSYKVWVNGQLVTQRQDMLWRYGNKGMIDSFIFSSFHGGNTADWAPRWDCFADFDDFYLSTQAPGNNRKVASQD